MIKFIAFCIVGFFLVALVAAGCNNEPMGAPEGVVNARTATQEGKVVQFCPRRIATKPLQCFRVR